MRFKKRFSEIEFLNIPPESFEGFGHKTHLEEYVNVYLVYLNDTADWRTDTSIINFEHEILGVYAGWDQTLYFDSSRFASNYYPIYVY